MVLPGAHLLHHNMQQEDSHTFKKSLQASDLYSASFGSKTRSHEPKTGELCTGYISITVGKWGVLRGCN